MAHRALRHVCSVTLTTPVSRHSEMSELTHCSAQCRHTDHLVGRQHCMALSALDHSTAQHTTAQHSTPQHSTPQHSTPHHSTAQHSTPQHSTAQHSSVSAALNRYFESCVFIASRKISSQYFSTVFSLKFVPTIIVNQIIRCGRSRCCRSDRPADRSDC